MRPGDVVLASDEAESGIDLEFLTQRGDTHITPQKGVILEVKQGYITHASFETSVTEEQRARWRPTTRARWIVGDIHATDVVPHLWRTLDVLLEQADGAIAQIQMIRPLWWIEQTGATEGGVIDLDITEAGLSGVARILSLRDDVAVDSRKVEGSIVLGKIRPERVKVLSLVLDGDETNAIGVTPNHPLFSADRQDWVPAGEFRIGEKIETEGGGTSTVTAIVLRANTEPVHNLEVHRAQSYYVGEQRLLAHNMGMKCDELIAKLPRDKQKSYESLKSRRDEHMTKRDACAADPEAFDNKGLLEKAPPERRQKIIEGRLKQKGASHKRLKSKHFEFLVEVPVTLRSGRVVVYAWRVLGERNDQTGSYHVYLANAPDTLIECEDARMREGSMRCVGRSSCCSVRSRRGAASPPTLAQ